MEVSRYAKGKWEILCQTLALDPHITSIIWDKIQLRYTEAGRYYHTLCHIEELLRLADAYENDLEKRSVVGLSIFFHDIVYDPKAGDNEEQSALMFQETIGPLLDANMCQVVCDYIIATKKHDVSSSDDRDLQYFIDFDLAVLGAERIKYTQYAAHIRHEYIHVEKNVYCLERSKFMRTFLMNTEHIYATTVFRDLLEVRARENISWECDLLEAGTLLGP